MSRLLGCALVCALIVLPACGGGSDTTTGQVAIGPFVFGLPFVPNASASESLQVGFRNFANVPATVHATAFLPGGAPYGPGMVDLTIPALGGLRVPLATFTGAALTLGGWVQVDTRSTATLDPATGEPTPTATSGYVAAYVQRSDTGLETDSSQGVAFRDDFAYVGLTPFTIGYQVINRSYTPMAGGSVPVGLTVDVTEYDAFGTPGVPFPAVIPANGSSSFVPTVSAGRIEVTPTGVAAGDEPRLAIAGLEADPQVMIEARFLTIRRDIPQRYVGFDLEFGQQTVVGGLNVFDFGVEVTNATLSDATVTLEAINRSNGTNILAAPRVIGIDAKRTKWLRTTDLNSLGLDLGETSPFSDIFGDVSTTTSLETFTMVFNVSPDVSISARAFNDFKSFYRILPGKKLTTDAAVLGVNVPTTTTTGVRNWISLMNPRDTSLDVTMRGVTPGGTEYYLDPIMVPARSRVDWSPDGMVFTEDPTSPTDPPVPFMAFRLTGQGGMFFNARRTRRASNELILTVTPHVVRDLRED